MERLDYAFRAKHLISTSAIPMLDPILRSELIPRANTQSFIVGSIQSLAFDSEHNDSCLSSFCHALRTQLLVKEADVRAQR